jgi:hypothetical protein
MFLKFFFLQKMEIIANDFPQDIEGSTPHGAETKNF